MPSIQDLFNRQEVPEIPGQTPPAGELGEVTPPAGSPQPLGVFNIDGIDAAVDALLTGSDDRVRDGQRTSHEPPPEPSVEPSAAEVEPEPVEPVEARVRQPPAPEVVVAEAPETDPVAAFLAKEIEDPETRTRVLAALPKPAPVEPPAPTLPEGIDPDSFEGRLWLKTEQVEQNQRQLAEYQRSQSEQMARAQAAGEAERAGQAMEDRYQGKLDQSDVHALARAAGRAGLPNAFATSAMYQGNLYGAYVASMEHVLAQAPEFQPMRDKLAGIETITPAKTPESATRQRKLTALSGGGGPVSEAKAPGPPLEHRTDGRLTGDGRQSLTHEIAKDLARSRQGA